MAGFKVGCQTYTWEMLGSRFAGGPDDLLAAICAAGYAGIEITDTMIGAYRERPADFSTALQSSGLTLVALAFASPSGFTLADRIGSDLEIARRWIDFAAAFPGALVSIGSPTEMSSGPREDKFGIAAEFCNRAGEIGRAAGVGVAMHPSSHHDTLLFDRADYDRMFALLDPALVGWVPDTGHMLRGGHDMTDTLATYRDRIRYVHLKDVDAAGNWAMLGQGVCDTPAVLGAVGAAPAFNGWVVVEEESEAAGADPARAVKQNRATMRGYGL
ncbi:MAG: sugar phosphate isomerase/epimerase [Rhizobiaceae bacterium]|nr:sugar phosphate isomerase/epimerase [Rhizobiaceae bacterium]